MDQLLFPLTLTVSLIVLLPVGIVSISLFSRPRPSIYSRFAAWITIKPVLLTPLWLYLCVFVVPEPPTIILALLPAWVYTIICAGYYCGWKKLKLSEAVFALLAIDTLRWSNSLLLMFHDQGEGWGLVITGFLLTYICAIVASGLVQDMEKKSE